MLGVEGSPLQYGQHFVQLVVVVVRRQGGEVEARVAASALLALAQLTLDMLLEPVEMIGALVGVERVHGGERLERVVATRHAERDRAGLAIRRYGLEALLALEREQADCAERDLFRRRRRRFRRRHARRLHVFAVVVFFFDF